MNSVLKNLIEYLISIVSETIKRLFSSITQRKMWYSARY